MSAISIEAAKSHGGQNESGSNGKISLNGSSQVDLVRHEPKIRSIPKITAGYLRETVHTPELLRKTHQDLWNNYFKVEGLQPSVEVPPPPPLLTSLIEGLENSGYAIAFMPHCLSGAEDRAELARMYRLSVTRVRDSAGEASGDITKPTNVYGEEGKKSEDKNGGFWYAYPRNRYPSGKYRDMTESQIAVEFAKHGLLPMTLSLYLAAVGNTRDFYGYTMDDAWTNSVLLSGSELDDKSLQGSWPKGYLSFNNNPVFHSHYPGRDTREVLVWGSENAHALYTDHQASRRERLAMNP